MPKGTPGFNILTRTHVEGEAAAIMRQQGMNHADLYINRASPCTIPQGCDALLPRMLPEGALLRVVGLNGFVKLFLGLPD